MFTDFKTRSPLVLAAMLVCGSSFAVPVTFFGEDVNLGGSSAPPLVSYPNSVAAEAAFLSNLTGVGTETFEGIASGTSNPTISFPGAGTATISGGGVVASGTIPGGRYPISGTNFYNAATGAFTIAFNAVGGISAFGFYGIDVGDYGGALRLELTTLGGDTVNVDVPVTVSDDGETSASVMYFGFYDLSTTYTSVSFLNTSGGSDVFGFDDFTIGTAEQVTPNPVSVPGSLPLLGAGLLALGLVGRRRKA